MFLVIAPFYFVPNWPIVIALASAASSKPSANVRADTFAKLFGNLSWENARSTLSVIPQINERN
jgi:hypothetical protein